MEMKIVRNISVLYGQVLIAPNNIPSVFSLPQIRGEIYPLRRNKSLSN